MTSSPSNITCPERLPSMPMIDLSAVVLPAPFRPRSVTTSPSLTSKLMPWRTWDSPYQASRLETSSDILAGLIMTGSQIGFLDRFVRQEFRIAALRQHSTAGQHRDLV